MAFQFHTGYNLECPFSLNLKHTHMNNNKNNNSAIDENGLNYHPSKQAVGPFTVAVPEINVKMHRSDKLNRKMLCQMQENSVLFLFQWSYCISQHNIF